jgi:hypothetical protein
MLKLPLPDYDAVVRHYPYRIEIAFANPLSPEIIQDIESLDCASITVKRDSGLF